MLDGRLIEGFVTLIDKKTGEHVNAQIMMAFEADGCAYTMREAGRHEVMHTVRLEAVDGQMLAWLVHQLFTHCAPLAESR